ncbi:MAG TPA: ADP-ribosylglycohydrolase family protein, partial [Thermomicrobiales bacterium]|nr:ADP-ribosylglycohydrolase family protein [Thermomicrobiales bacterium]
MALPLDYAERVYAGVLGKIVGVYLGRPVEGWSLERIVAEHGELDRYVPDPRGAPLVLTDDDISGTFIFLRALPDRGNDPGLTPRQIGETWLNYLIEERTILWWGGVGNSTEHTAFIRLKQGVPAPESGSRARNGKTISEQIGSQIFIDGWGMVCPGDPEKAADFARRAASVSHDGEAIYGAQVVAAMEAQAFVESDIDRLLDTAVGLIPADSTIRRLIDDVRGWHATERDWRQTREKIAANYGYDKYRGACHMVPNHALIVHALLHGEDDFRRSLTIVNTCGWDTDCNSGNVGCLLGIKNGLATLDASPYDWRGPVADRLYLATADGGRAISDAVHETFEVVNIGRALAGEGPIAPKDGARVHFSLPGSVQGFQAEGEGAAIANVERGGERMLELSFQAAVAGDAARTATPTFIPEEAIAMPGYTLLASPTLYPGQEVSARLLADDGNPAPVACRLFLRVYGADDRLETVPGPQAELAPGGETDLTWRVPDTGGHPVAEIGLEATAGAAGPVAVALDCLGWSGAADATFARPAGSGAMWRRAWVDGVDLWEARWPQAYRIVQNEGCALISQGTADWVDYRAEATVSVPLAGEGGIAVRVAGQRRWYGLLLGADGIARRVKAADGRRSLAQAAFPLG